jgi:high-affinity nickel-transport protein
VLGVFALGFRHGFDMDHVAAITDITGSQLVRARAFVLSTLYAAGHAAMVIVLGLGIAWAGWDIPDMGRLIGATLVALGSYVLFCVATDRAPRSRGGLVMRATQRISERFRPTTSVQHEHSHSHDADDDPLHRHTHAELVALAPEAGAGDPTAVEPEAVTVATRHRHLHRHDDVPAPYGAVGALTVGLIHGIGAETPTQVLALAGGTVSLVPFLTGLVLANTVVAVAAVIGVTPRRLRVLNGLVGAFSLYVGIPYLLGTSPPFIW